MGASPHEPRMLASTSSLSHTMRLNTVPGLHAANREPQALFYARQRIAEEELFDAPAPPQPLPPLVPSSNPTTAYVPVSLANLNLKSAAPEVPAAAFDVSKTKLSASIKAQAARHANGMAGLVEDTSKAITAFVNNPTDRASPSVISQRLGLRCMRRWTNCIHFHSPNIPESAYWHVGVVAEFAPKFLMFLVQFTAHMQECKTIKSRTLLGWFGHLVHCIIKYTRDPGQNNKPCGVLLLTKHNLFNTLRSQVPQYSVTRVQP
ncbi:hypothetical protein DXG01_009523 [Tephrocybe rancida]|nr:hypothetical protein DXG01_009523 [Tephrocybe rancida]